MTGRVPNRDRASKVADGPRVASWRCPSCSHHVPRLLPNGVVNRYRLGAADATLPAPIVATALRAQGAVLEKEVCLGCRDAIRELLGTLVVPPGQRGTVLGGSGEAGTRVIGAVVPGLSEQPELWILGSEHGRVALLERLEWGAFEPARMTYPERQGAIDHRIWQLYREHLQALRSRLEEQP